MSTKLWYDRYVDDWMHALPLGNGRIGAMLYGNPDREVIEINEESLWSGRQLKERNHATPEDLAKILKSLLCNRPNNLPCSGLLFSFYCQKHKKQPFHRDFPYRW